MLTLDADAGELTLLVMLMRMIVIQTPDAGVDGGAYGYVDGAHLLAHAWRTLTLMLML